MLMAATAKLTLDEYLKLPETKPYREFVDGEVVVKTMGTLGHSLAQNLLAFVLMAYLRVNPIGIAATELRCIFRPVDGEVARLPDIVFIAADRVQGAVWNGPFYGAPDLAVEILSPDDRWVDVMAKLRFYLENGVRMVWLVDPIGRTVMVLSSPSESHILTESEVLTGGDVLPGFSVAVKEVLPPADQPNRS
jgi:Uma2 family endonuclease